MDHIKIRNLSRNPKMRDNLCVPRAPCYLNLQLVHLKNTRKSSILYVASIPQRAPYPLIKEYALNHTWGSNYLQFSGVSPLIRGSNLLNCR